MSRRSSARREEVGLLLLEGQSWDFQGILAMHFLTFKSAYISFRFKIEVEFIGCYRFSCNLNILFLFRLLPYMMNLNRVQ